MVLRERSDVITSRLLLRQDECNREQSVANTVSTTAAVSLPSDDPAIALAWLSADLSAALPSTSFLSPSVPHRLLVFRQATRLLWSEMSHHK